MSRDERGRGPKPLANSAARRVEAIIEGAERAAERVIDDAESKARAYLTEAEADADRAVEERLAALAVLTDSLVEQAEAIRRQAEELTAALREAQERLEGENGASPAARARRLAEVEDPSPTPHLAAVEPERKIPEFRSFPQRRGEEVEGAEDDEAAPVERRGRGTPAGARLLATQMAVSGSSREEIAARLRTGFEIEDADAILDAILGPEA